MIAKYIDHTKLKLTATPSDIEKLCAEALEHGFRAVCVNMEYARLAVNYLTGSDVNVAVVIDFPLGAGGFDTKITGVRFAQHYGVDEVDVVWNLGAFKNGEYWKVLRELHRIVDTSGNLTVKIIVETACLTPDELVKAFDIVSDSGVEYIKTSTGYIGELQHTAVRVWQSRKTMGSDLKIKASGCIRSYSDCMGMLNAGADIVGTSSGIKIITEEKSHV